MRVVYDAAGWNALAERPGWVACLLVVVILAVGMAAVAGWRERVLARRGWPGLLALRLVALLALVALLLGFERREVVEQTLASRVLLLVDRSASMTLTGGAGRARAELAESARGSLAGRLAPRHEVVLAEFDAALSYPGDRTPRTPGPATHLGGALQRGLADFSTAPLAAVILISDGGWNGGVDPQEAAVAAKRRGVPVHTLGVGLLEEPAQVMLRDLAAPSRAATSDPFEVRVTASANAAAAVERSRRDVRIRLLPLDRDERPGAPVAEETLELALPREGGGITAKRSLSGVSPGRYRLEACLDPLGDGAAEPLVKEIEIVEAPTRVLLAAGGPSRDYGFLRDELFRDGSFKCDVLLQTAIGAVTQDASGVVAGLPDDAEGWEAYDALVAIDLDWRLVDEAAQRALAEWVSRRGGGFAFVAGAVATPSLARQRLAGPLRSLLPVRLRDDALRLGGVEGAASDPRPVHLATAAETFDWLMLRSADDPSGSLWRGFDGLYGATVSAEPKPGATVLARYGDGAAESALLVEHLYGAGRVAYLATPELWRLRKVSPAALTRFQVGWLRRLCENRRLAPESAGLLLFDKPRYDLGETASLRYLADASSDVSKAEARVGVNDGPVVPVTLGPVEGQPGVLAASLVVDREGTWTASFGAGEDALSARAEVTLPSRESDTTVQNSALLQDLASLTGGKYLDLSSSDSPSPLAALADSIASASETRSELGPPDEGFSSRYAWTSFGTLALALMVEWGLRRLWRLA